MAFQSVVRQAEFLKCDWCFAITVSATLKAALCALTSK